MATRLTVQVMNTMYHNYIISNGLLHYIDYSVMAFLFGFQQEVAYILPKISAEQLYEFIPRSLQNISTNLSIPDFGLRHRVFDLFV